MNIEHLSIEQLEDLKDILISFIDYSYAGIIKNNFIESFYKYTVDDVLYGNYKIFGAKSFRLTSSSPNMLNSPSTGSIYAKPIKKCFEARDNNIFYAVDLSALEDRIIANLSRDSNKCSIFTHGIDGHCLNSYYYFKDEIEKELPRRDNEEEYEYIKRYKEEVDKGNKTLKSIRQRGKPVTFGLSYGCHPPKVAKSIKCSIEEAENIFNNYHNKLYKDITHMRDKVLLVAKNKRKIHLGLGCYINTSEPEKEIRTYFNACSQFWSIITLLTINKLNSIIKENNLDESVRIVSSIYDSIYIYLFATPSLICWLNNTIIPILTKDIFVDTLVHNEATGEIGFNWYDMVEIRNNASEEEVKEALEKAKELFNGSEV